MNHKAAQIQREGKLMSPVNGGEATWVMLLGPHWQIKSIKIQHSTSNPQRKEVFLSENEVFEGSVFHSLISI